MNTELTYEQQIGKAFFDLANDASSREIRKLKKQIENLKAENKALKQANGADTGQDKCYIQRVIQCIECNGTSI